MPTGIYKRTEKMKSSMSKARIGMKLSEEHKRNMSKALKGRTYEEIYGKETAKKIKRLTSERMKGQHTSPKTEFKKGHLICKGMKFPKNEYPNKGMSNKKHLEETKRKMSEAQKGKKASKETREQLSKIHKKLWLNEEYQKMQREAQRLKPNKKEQKLNNLLKIHFPKQWKYVGDFNFWLGGKNPDFMNCNGQKLLIELFGDYWHEKSEIKPRINHFKKYGFSTLIIWEHELKNEQEVLKKICEWYHLNKVKKRDNGKGKEEVKK